MKKTFLSGMVVWFFCLCLADPAWCQEEVQEATSKTHRLTVMMANAFIPAADDVTGQDAVFIVPAWGVNYDYWVNQKFGLGVHTDFILQQFKIEKTSDETVIERSFPVVVTGVFLWKPFEKLTLLAGGGKELEKHESFALVNVGIEYGIELPDSWELNLNLIYDNKLDAYDSWMFGVGFSKLFRSY